MQFTPSYDQPHLEKVITNEEKAKWSTWPSTLVGAVNRSIQEAKAQALEKVQAFRAAQTNSDTLSPLIALIDEGEPIRADDDLPLPLLTIPIKEIMVTHAAK